MTDALYHYLENDFDKVEIFNYFEGRRFLAKLIRELFKKNVDSFGSEEEVRTMFIKAQFDGNIIPVARLVKKTFGKDAFIRLGQGEDITL